MSLSAQIDILDRGRGAGARFDHHVLVGQVLRAETATATGRGLHGIRPLRSRSGGTLRNHGGVVEPSEQELARLARSDGTPVHPRGGHLRVEGPRTLLPRKV